MSRKIQRKQQKQKAKERENQKKKVENQLFRVRRERYERELKQEETANEERLKPIRNKSYYEKVQAAVDKNIEMLEVLEKEYLEAQKNKQNLQEELEAEGYSTLEEKMTALRQKSIDLLNKVNQSVDSEQTEIKEELTKLTNQNNRKLSAKIKKSKKS